MGNRLRLFNFLGLFLTALILVSCRATSQPAEEDPIEPGPVTVNPADKIDGVAFVSPRNMIGPQEAAYMLEANAGWVQHIPYGFTYPNSTEVHFNTGSQWWGESVEGTRSMIKDAKALGMKVLLKPHVWIIGQGWAGNFELSNEEDWASWEESYKEFIMAFARMAEMEEVELFCVGTEMKAVTRARPQYFGNLADSVRKVFSGEVTYAANWDNYELVQFWDRMDLIGVDGYFPLLPDTTPEVDSLVKAWSADKAKLEDLYRRNNKPIVFTEWGYLSTDQCGWRTWEIEGNLSDYNLNMEAQRNCYEAFFQALWDEPWFAGGFAWQWYADHPNAGGLTDKDHTPQNKPAFEVLREWYGKQ